MKPLLRCAVAAALCFLATHTACAQDAGAVSLAGTLKKVRDSGTITLGYREASFPFSYRAPAGPIGYSIDLCLAVVEEIKREIDEADIKVAYELVTSETRMAAVTSGKV